MRRHLILIANTYPFSGSVENSFIDPELPYLLEAFDTVSVAPERLEGSKLEMDSRALFDASLATALGKGKPALALRGIFSIEFFRELMRYPWLLLRWKTLARVALYSGRAQLVGAWVSRVLSERRLYDKEVVIYLYWCAHSAYGCALLKRKLPGLKVVSRAHGDDLYEARHRPDYIPFRKRALHFIDAVLPDSEAGVAYLKGKWPEYREKFFLARLGVNDPGCHAHQSSDGVLRVVTCSSLTNVKRVGLVVDGLAELTKIQPDLHIEWNHFGAGPLRSAIEEAAARLPPSVRWHFHGHVSGAFIRSWYSERPVDVFVNVSSSEGTPVSIMEAISFGIPIVATAVGGNCEITDTINGVLLPANPQAGELACALGQFSADAAELSSLRVGSRLMWTRRYDACKNFSNFACQIQSEESKSVI